MAMALSSVNDLFISGRCRIRHWPRSV